MRQTVLSAAVVFSLLLAQMAWFALPDRTSAQTDEAAQIRDLAERLLANPSYGLASGSPTVQLYLGQMPPDMPFPSPRHRVAASLAATSAA